tara:strand:+ start:301 stop:1557 length:1257 start_codon:yes stop_codon:yes gene_type:complete
MKITYCKKCLNPHNHPLGIYFDKQGVCGGCIVHEEKYQIDWDEKFKSLKKIFNRKGNSFYDCVIPINGNGDDFFVTHYVKKILKLNPLLVSYNNHFNSKIGIRNTARLISSLDCDHINMTLNPDIVKKITRGTFDLIEDVYWHVLSGNQSFPVQIALRMNIPFIIWGVNGWLEQVGKYSHNDNAEMNKRIWEEFSLRNLSNEKVFKKIKVNQKDLAPLIYPPLQEIYKKNLRGIYLGNYILWDSKKQTEQMIKLYGYETMKQSRTHNTYESIYCKINAGSHDLIKFLKYRYGKVIDHINRDIRFKRISRAEAKYIVYKYQSKIPDDLDTFLRWSKINKNLFFKKLLKFNSFKIKNNKIFDNDLNIVSNLGKKSLKEIDKIEKKLNYLETNKLEKENLSDQFNIFGRTYMDDYNYKALE